MRKKQRRIPPDVEKKLNKLWEKTIIQNEEKKKKKKKKKNENIRLTLWRNGPLLAHIDR